MAEYKSMTFPNPMDRTMRVWSWVDRDTREAYPLVMTDITPFDGFISLRAIVSPERQGTGQASVVLRIITEMADKHEVAITLGAKPFGNVPNALSKSKLMAWYKRYGWVNRPEYAKGSGAMIRAPR